MRWTLLSRVLRRIGGLLVGYCCKWTLPEVADSSSSHAASQPSAPGRESCPQQSASATSFRPILEAACCGQLSRGSRRFAAARSRFHPQIWRKRHFYYKEAWAWIVMIPIYVIMFIEDKRLDGRFGILVGGTATRTRSEQDAHGNHH
jgi:hypothetical protein